MGRSGAQPELDEVRGAFLDALLARVVFMDALSELTIGFPPEVILLANRHAEAYGAEATVLALRTVIGIQQMDGEKQRGTAVALSVGRFLGMDPRDPNMRIWAGETAKEVFGL